MSSPHSTWGEEDTLFFFHTEREETEGGSEETQEIADFQPIGTIYSSEKVGGGEGGGGGDGTLQVTNKHTNVGVGA